MTFALEPACPLFVVVVASTKIPRRNEPGLLGPGQAPLLGAFHLGRRLYNSPGLSPVIDRMLYCRSTSAKS